MLVVEIQRLAIPDVLELRTARHGDERGFFSETWNKDAWESAGVSLDFVQHNHSLSALPGVLRGLHYQLPPVAQDKLIRVTRGAIFDVAVDIRRSSPTFGQWVGQKVSATDWNQLLVPKGFAHGFLTLEPDTEVQYNVTARYSPDHDRAIRYDDPAIGIDWPRVGGGLILSPKDAAAPLLAEAELFA